MQSARAAHRAGGGFGAELIERKHNDGPAVLLGQSTGHKPDHAGVPTATGEHESGVACKVAHFADLFVGGEVDAAFQTVAAAVELVDVLGQRLGTLRRVGGEQLDAKLGLTESAGGIEARTDREGDILAPQRFLVVELGDGHQCGEAWDRVLFQRDQPVVHENAVLVQQRHHVGHRAERRQTDRLQQKLAQVRADLGRLAGAAAQRPGKFERDGRSAQIAERIAMAGQTRMDDGRGAGEFRTGLVMIGDDELDTQLLGGERFACAGDAAVDGNDERGAGILELRERFVADAVSVVEPAGQVIADIAAEQLEAAIDERGGGHAVGVVIAVDDDAAAGFDCAKNAIDRLRNARQLVGIAQAAEPRIEKTAGLIGVGDAAGQEQLGHDGGDAGTLFQSRHSHRVVRTNAPPLAQAILKGKHTHPGGPCEGGICRDYFFFSTWTVCLRRRGLYFLSLSFSPPGLRRSE